MKVKIGGLHYKIKLVPDRRLVVKTGGRANGQIHWQKQKITISTNMEPALFEQTLLHEIVHGIVEAHKITTMMDDEERHNEANVDRMAIGLQEALHSLGINLHELFMGKTK
jgi:Zn-dependent peptidase ImmA (M78 family)